MRFTLSVLTCLAVFLLFQPVLAHAATPAGTLPVSVLDKPLPTSVIDQCACVNCACPHCAFGSDFCPCAVAKPAASVTATVPVGVATLKGFKRTSLDPSVVPVAPSEAEQAHWKAHGGWTWYPDQGGYWYRPKPAAAIQPTYQPVTYTAPTYYGSFQSFQGGRSFFRGSRGGSCSGGG